MVAQVSSSKHQSFRDSHIFQFQSFLCCPMVLAYKLKWRQQVDRLSIMSAKIWSPANNIIESDYNRRSSLQRKQRGRTQSRRCQNKTIFLWTRIFVVIQKINLKILEHSYERLIVYFDVLILKKSNIRYGKHLRKCHSLRYKSSHSMINQI